MFKVFTTGNFFFPVSRISSLVFNNKSVQIECLHLEESTMLSNNIHLSLFIYLNEM